MKSTIDNQQADFAKAASAATAEPTILSPVYFPFTFIPPSLVEAMSLCFQHVVVYQPAHSGAQRVLQPWVDTGFMDVRSPFEKVIEKRQLESALRDIRSWSLLHQHADLAYLKMVGNDIGPVGPETPMIVSDIKKMAEGITKEPEENKLPVQLFLHLAYEFDQQSWELSRQLNGLDDKFQALQSSFRQDQDQSEQGFAPATEGVLPVEEIDPGDFVIEKRIAAWRQIFRKDPVNAGVIFTRSRFALASLLDKAQDKVELLKFHINFTRDESSGASKERPAWADNLWEIFNTVLAASWDQRLQERAVDMGRELEASVDKEKEFTTNAHDRSVFFSWYVVPGQNAHGLLSRCCGLDISYEEDKTDKYKNILVGLVEECSRSPKN